MEDNSKTLQDLYIKQTKFELDLAKTKLSLYEKIKENYKIMKSELKSHTDRVLKMVEETFAETEDKVKGSFDVTANIMKDLKLKAEILRNEVGEKNEAVVKGGKARKSGSRISEMEKVHCLKRDVHESESANELKEQNNLKLTCDDLRLTLKRKRKSDEIQHCDETLQHKSNSLVQSKELIQKAKRAKPSPTKYSIKQAEYGSYNIKTLNDSTVCDINSVCCLENGKILLVDTNNECLKSLDIASSVVKVIQGNQCRFIDTTFSICHDLNRNGFVLSSNNWRCGQLMYVSIDTTKNLPLNECVCTGIRNWSVISHGGYIYILCENRKYQNYNLRWYDNNGGARESSKIQGQYMCFNSEGSQLYITRGITKCNRSNDVTVFDSKNDPPTTFTENFKFSAPDLKVPCGVVVDKNDQVYVCGFESKNVLQFDKDGNRVGVVMEDDDALNGPKALGYDKLNHRLIVAGNADVIKVFDLN